MTSSSFVMILNYRNYSPTDSITNVFKNTNSGKLLKKSRLILPIWLYCVLTHSNISRKFPEASHFGCCLLLVDRLSRGLGGVVVPVPVPVVYQGHQ